MWPPWEAQRQMRRVVRGSSSWQWYHDDEGQIMPTPSHWCKSPWHLSLGSTETTASFVVLCPTDQWRRHRVDGGAVRWPLPCSTLIGGQNIADEADMDSWERQTCCHKIPNAFSGPVNVWILLTNVKYPFTMFPSAPVSIIEGREQETLGRKFWTWKKDWLLVVTRLEMGPASKA